MFQFSVNFHCFFSVFSVALIIVAYIFLILILDLFLFNLFNIHFPPEYNQAEDISTWWSNMVSWIIHQKFFIRVVLLRLSFLSALSLHNLSLTNLSKSFWNRRCRMWLQLSWDSIVEFLMKNAFVLRNQLKIYLWTIVLLIVFS